MQRRRLRRPWWRTPGLRDFGTVSRSTCLQGVIIIKNVSDETITISGFSQTIPSEMSLGVSQTTTPPIPTA